MLNIEMKFAKNTMKALKTKKMLKTLQIKK